MTEIGKPELGSTEAAVLTVVELIARAAQMSEAHLAYWLDLYYQVRRRHEEPLTPVDVSELMVKVEEPDPVLMKLDELEKKIDTIGRRQVAAPELNMKIMPVTPIDPRDADQMEHVTKIDKETTEDAAAGVSKKNRS